MTAKPRERPMFARRVLRAVMRALFGGLYARGRLQRAGAEARARRQGFDALMHVAQQALVVADERDRIVEWSAGAEELLGHAAAEVVGQPLSSLSAPSDVAALEAEIGQARRGREPGRRFELQGRRSDG